MSTSPLAQFEIKPLVTLPPVAGVDLSFTNSSLFMALAALATIALTGLAPKRRALVPMRWQALTEIYYDFVATLLKDIAGVEARPYFPFIFCVFSFVLFGNLLGMVPYGFTFTSHIIVTLALALLVFVTVTVIGFIKHGLHFFHLFLPAGTPLAMAPILVPLEIFSYCVRPITLSVRLFANMLAGHILLKVIIGFVAVMGLSGIAPFAVTVALIGFEIFVALLQAYIFALLSCVYLKDALHLH